MSVASALKAQRAINAQLGERVAGAAPIILTDFLTGGAASFARACSVEGDVIEFARTTRRRRSRSP